MVNGITLEVVWSDEHLIQFRAVCANRSFSGAVYFYAEHNDVFRFADLIDGFPQNPGDLRTAEFGTFNSDRAGGGLRAEFRVSTPGNRSEVDVYLRADHCKEMGKPESLSLSIPIDPASVDRFVAELRQLSPSDTGSSATLEMSDT